MPSNSVVAHGATKPRLRIAHVILSRGFAGSERSTAESCNAQCDAHDVLLIIRRDHRSASGASIRDALDARVSVVEIPARWFTQRHLARAIREWRPDVVHAHLRRSTRFLARIDPPAAKISTLHLGLNGPHFMQMDGLICISPWQVREIPASFGGRVFSIPNSLVPHPRLSPTQIAELRTEMGAEADCFVVGGTGRLAHSKGFDILIRAFERAALPNARLVIVGEGRERSRLEKLAGPNVRLLGFRRNVKDYYQAFDVFVCPSRREPMGRVILEALDAATPVIAADVSGPREILSQYPGELVSAENIDALATAITRRYQSGRTRTEVDLSVHHLEHVSQVLIAAYRQALTDRG